MKKNFKKTISLILMICFAICVVNGIFQAKFSTAVFAALLTAILFFIWKKQPHMVEKSQHRIKNKASAKTNELHFNVLSQDFQDEIKSLIKCKNFRYEYSKKEFLDNVQENEEEYEYDFENSDSHLGYIDKSDSVSGKPEMNVFIANTQVGTVKWGAVQRLKGYIDRNEIDHIYVELTGGKYKSYSLDDEDKPEWDSDESDYGADLYVYIKSDC